MNDISIYAVYDRIQVSVSVAVVELVVEAETKKKFVLKPNIEKHPNFVSWQF